MSIIFLNVVAGGLWPRLVVSRHIIHIHTVCGMWYVIGRLRGMDYGLSSLYLATALSLPSDWDSRCSSKAAALWLSPWHRVSSLGVSTATYDVVWGSYNKQCCCVIGVWRVTRAWCVVRGASWLATVIWSWDHPAGVQQTLHNKYKGLGRFVPEKKNLKKKSWQK